MLKLEMDVTRCNLIFPIDGTTLARRNEMRIGSIRILLVGMCLLVAAANAQAATTGRIMTSDKATLYKNGQAVSTYTDQGPLDENALIGCEGSCLVKMHGISLHVADQTMFALKDSGDSVNLYLQKGTIHFIISDTARRFAFYTPDGYVVRTEGFIAPAATEQTPVKGFVQVAADKTEIGMESGTMVVRTDDGTTAINPGQSLVLAMADVPDKDGEKGNSPRGGIVPVWENMSTFQQVGTVAVGMGAAAGIAYVTFWDTSDGSPGAPGPAGPPPPPPPRQASPNR